MNDEKHKAHQRQIMCYYSYRIVVGKQYDRHRWSLLSQLLSVLYNLYSKNYSWFVAFDYIAVDWSTFCLFKFVYYYRHMTHLSLSLSIAFIYKQTSTHTHKQYAEEAALKSQHSVINK